MRILISAGEPSGDLHGAGLAGTILRGLPGVEIDALGGSHLAAAGATVRFPMDRHTAIGFVEILGAIPAHWKMLRTLDRDLGAGRYDLVIPIDYPGFNLRLAERARGHGIPVLYYIAPKHWAARTRLTGRLAKAVNRLACIFPFEPAFFSPFGIAAEFVGHPLLDRPPPMDRATARRRLEIREGERVVALFPGSRRQEVTRLWAPMRDAARILLTESRCDRVIVAAMPGMSYPGAGPGRIEILTGQPELALAAADGAIVKSGTATLQAALASVPMVVIYRVHPMTAWLARRLIRVPWISMVNLIAERGVVPELLQEAISARGLADALGPLLDPEHQAATTQREGFALVRQRLGTSGATDRVAGIARELLQSETRGRTARRESRTPDLAVHGD